MRRFFLLTTLALVPALFCSAPAMAAKAKPKTATAANGAYPLLPAGPGRDVEIRVCSQCHSPDRPAAQRHDLAGWNVILDQMATNGAKASDAEFDQIAAYLTRAFPPGKK